MVNWETIILSIISAIVVAFITPLITHKFSLNRIEREHRNKLDYMQKEILFQRRIKYSEDILRRINEDGRRLSRQIDIISKRLSFEDVMEDFRKTRITELQTFDIDYNLNNLYGFPIEISEEINEFTNLASEITERIVRILEQIADSKLVSSETKLELNSLKSEMAIRTINIASKIRKYIKTE